MQNVKALPIFNRPKEAGDAVIGLDLQVEGGDGRPGLGGIDLARVELWVNIKLARLPVPIRESRTSIVTVHAKEDDVADFHEVLQVC